MFQKFLFPKLLLVFNLVLIALTSVTLASAHGGNAALIHACVNNTSGELKIVGANAACPNNYRALDWNIQGSAGQQGPIGPAGPVGPVGPVGAVGPVGPIGPMGPIGPQGLQGLPGLQGEQGSQGLQGEQGPQGLQGIQGLAGISGLEVVNADSDFQTTNVIDISVRCPAGKQVIGGGFSIVSAVAGDLNVRVSAPFAVNDSNGWGVSVITGDYPNTFPDWAVRAIAICAYIAP